MEELPKLSRYQKFIMVFFVTVIVLLLFPSFVPKTFIVSTVLNNVGATGILLGAVGVYIMVSLKEGMPAVQLFSKNIGWSIIFILAAALSIADAMAAESTGISAWLVELITPVVQGKSPLVLTAVMCVVGMALTNVANNIATAAMLTPIAYSGGHRLRRQSGGTGGLCAAGHQYGYGNPARQCSCGHCPRRKGVDSRK